MNKSPCVGSGLTLWIPATTLRDDGKMTRRLGWKSEDFPAWLALESCRKWVRNEYDHPRSTAICPSCIVLKSPWHAVMNKRTVIVTHRVATAKFLYNAIYVNIWTVLTRYHEKEFTVGIQAIMYIKCLLSLTDTKTPPRLNGCSVIKESCIQMTLTGHTAGSGT